MKRILVIGKKSLLSFKIEKYLKNKYYVKRLSFPTIKKNKKSLLKFNFIINCTFNKNLSNFKRSSDFILASYLVNKKITYIMISSCKVYGSNKVYPVSEKKKCKPITDYGKKKFILEKKLKKILKNKLLILRVSNILQFDIRESSKLMTFINKMLIHLKNKNIIYIPKNKFLKDFLPIDHFNLALYQLIRNNITGIYNIGSGVGLTIFEFAKLLIKGYGSGDIIKVNASTDNIILSINKLKKKIDYELSKKQIKKYIIKLGEQLKYL